ncbi:hypothetical protein [Nocardia cyriacigeorgica]|uniref:hypothetical protein n=1 Tax=Nocardia cyriacigeorgica TaxID=135487 RepID=UPI00245732F4|nr:hypothetical protein [Nocardia cyriacigeorgica]
MANDSSYSLGSAVYSRKQGLEIARRLRAGATPGPLTPPAYRGLGHDVGAQALADRLEHRHEPGDHLG